MGEGDSNPPLKRKKRKEEREERERTLVMFRYRSGQIERHSAPVQADIKEYKHKRIQ